MKTLRYLTLALLAAGCPQGTKLVLPNPPTIDKFTATPASVQKGGMVTLEWGTTDATEVEILQVGVGPVTGVDNKATGTTKATLNEQGLFVLNAANSRGVKVTAITTVTVEGAAQQVLFAALPTLLKAPGETVTLVWNAPGANNVTITPMGGTALDLKGQVQAGSVTATPTGPTRYTLSADGTTKTVDVGFTQQVTSFTASKPLADAGEVITLSWQTENATAITLTQPGRGVLASSSSADGGTVMAAGSVMDTVPPYATGTIVPYQLTVEGAGPTVTRVAEVVIGNGPAIRTFTGPEYARTGGQFTLAWSTLNADAIELAAGTTVFYRSLTAAEAANGSLKLDTPAMTTDYTLTAINTAANVRVTKTLQQKVVGTATVMTFTALPATVPAGGDAVTLTWNVPSARRVVITDGAGHTVASAHGPAAETGTGTAYPNGPTTYRLVADNRTGEPEVSATAAVTVTAPAQFGVTDAVLAGTPATVTWTIGTSGLIGYPGGAPVVNAASTGFVDISTTGTKLTLSSDDATASFTPLDFETFLYGSRISGTFTASTNGFVALVPSASARGTTAALPNATVELNFLAPWWADLTVPATGGVYWEVKNEAPERTLIVQWEKVAAKAATGSELTFQVKVHQTGQVTFEYKTLTALGSVVPVIGVQGPPNTATLGTAPTSGGRSTTFFGGVMPPLVATFLTPSVVTGFIKMTNGYLHPRATIDVVRVGDVSVTEVMYNPSPALPAGEGEWVEIFNRSGSVINLAGWSLDLADAGSVVIDAGLTLPAGGSVLLGQVLRDAGNDNVNTVFAYGPLALPEAPSTVSIGIGGFRAFSTYTPALAGSDAGISVNIDGQPHLVVGDSTTLAPHAINCNSTTPIGAQTPQQRATPGVFQRCGIPMTMTSIPVSYFDISSFGTPLFATFSNRDDSIAPVDISSAPFPYEGTMVSQVVASTNGFLVIKPYTGSSNLTNKTVPSTTAPVGSTAAIFWDDLDTNLVTGVVNDVYAGRVAPGMDPQNPGGHWIVQWHHWAHNSSQNGDDYNFQVKLFDTGVIEYHYAAMVSATSGNLGNGNGATVWLDSLDGGVALVSSVNQPNVVPQSAIRFTP